MFSHLFRGVTLADGSGGPLGRADVAVAAGRIAEVSPEIEGLAETVTDGAGLVLAPGFIDIHSHSDMTLFRYPLMESKALQGVTTEVVGNCGLGMFPVRGGGERDLAEYLGIHGFILPDGGIGWSDLEGWADRTGRSGFALNIAPLVGHASLRIAAMGMDDRAPTSGELAAMAGMLTAALAQGAWGLSTGLIYPPGSYATTDEIISLARALVPFGALYASHIRGEGDGVMAAVDETIAIGRESGCRVQISHLKAMGSRNRGLGIGLLAKIAAARSFGVDAGADQYPYAASATSLSAVVPQWAHAGGVRELLGRLTDPGVRERLVVEIGTAMAAREGAEGIMVAGCSRNRALSGRTVADIAAIWQCPAEEAVIRLLVEEEGEVDAVFFSMAEEDVAAILADPEVAVGSDGHAMSASDAAGATHPRSYGTFPRVLGRYVRKEKLLSLPAAVRKMTSLPAARLGFTDRGVVRAGFAADLVLFDPEKIADRATYTDPHRYSTGIVHLLVGGRPVVWDGKITGEMPGRVLRKTKSGI